MGGARPAGRARGARSRAAGVADDAIDALEAAVAERARRRPSTRPGARPTPASSTLFDFVVRPAARPIPSRRPCPPTRRSSARWTRSTTRSRSSSTPTSGCSSPASTSAPAATSSASPVACTTASATGSATRPISETAIMGLGVGAAMAGMRPVVELMYLDFLGVCLDQLLNQAAKLPFMTGGAAQMAPDRADPVRRRALVGQPALAEPRGAARPHPRPDRGDAVDAGRHLRPAARRHPGPEPGGLHREPPALRHEGPPAAGRPHRARSAGSAVVRPGTDVTVVSVSRMVHEALAAAEAARRRGHLGRGDRPAHRRAARHRRRSSSRSAKTSRLLIAHEAVVPFGIGAEIAAVVADEGFWNLDAPIERIGAAATPPPYAPDLEQAWLPDRDDIAAAHPPPRRRLIRARSDLAVSRSPDRPCSCHESAPALTAC